MNSDVYKCGIARNASQHNEKCLDHHLDVIGIVKIAEAGPEQEDFHLCSTDLPLLLSINKCEWFAPQGLPQGSVGSTPRTHQIWQLRNLRYRLKHAKTTLFLTWNYLFWSPSNWDFISQCCAHAKIKQPSRTLKFHRLLIYWIYIILLVHIKK